MKLNGNFTTAMENICYYRSIIFLVFLLVFSTSCKKDKGEEPVKEVELLKARLSAKPTRLEEGDTVKFTDHSLGEPLEWKWYFGDGDSSTMQNPFHVYSDTGIYTITFIVNNEDQSDTVIEEDFIIVDEYTPVCPSTVTDVDGNTYQVVEIAEKCWMAENLATLHYADGTPVEKVELQTEWDNLVASDAAFCWYENDKATYGSTYGALYTWAAATRSQDGEPSDPHRVQGICPEGWRLPSDQEWEDMETTLGGSNKAGGKLKITDTLYWKSPNTGATNSTGFSALPGGTRGSFGSFSGVRKYGYFWTSSSYDSKEAWGRILLSKYEYVTRAHDMKTSGFSVRCVKKRE